MLASRARGWMSATTSKPVVPGLRLDVRVGSGPVVGGPDVNANVKTFDTPTAVRSGATRVMLAEHDHRF